MYEKTTQILPGCFFQCFLCLSVLAGECFGGNVKAGMPGYFSFILFLILLCEAAQAENLAGFWQAQRQCAVQLAVIKIHPDGTEDSSSNSDAERKRKEEEERKRREEEDYWRRRQPQIVPREEPKKNPRKPEMPPPGPGPAPAKAPPKQYPN